MRVVEYSIGNCHPYFYICTQIYYDAKWVMISLQVGKQIQSPPFKKHRERMQDNGTDRTVRLAAVKKCGLLESCHPVTIGRWHFRTHFNWN